MRVTVEKHPNKSLKSAGIRRCDTCTKEEFMKKPSRWDLCKGCERKDGLKTGRRKQHIQVKRMCYINYCECCKKAFEVKSRFYQEKQILKHCVDCSNKGVWRIGVAPANKKYDRKDMHPRLLTLAPDGSNEHAWRLKIIKQRGFRCELTGDIGVQLACHHIESFKRNPMLQFSESNLVVIRADLHKRFHINKMGGWGKDYTKQNWLDFVQETENEVLKCQA